MCGLVFLVFFLIGLYLVFVKRWLWVWLRANIGIGLLFASLVGVAGLFTLSAMEPVDGAADTGTLQVTTMGDTASFAKLKAQGSQNRDIELIQSQWRLRAIGVRWGHLFQVLGVSDGFLLYDLQQLSASNIESTTQLEKNAVVQVWLFGSRYLQWIPGITFDLMSTDWFSKDNKTTYRIHMTQHGLSLKDTQGLAKPGTAAILFEKSSGSGTTLDMPDDEQIPSEPSPAQVPVEPAPMPAQ